VVPEALVDPRISSGKARGLPGAGSEALLNLLKDLARILLQVVVRLVHLLLLGGQGVAAVMGPILGGIELKVKSKGALTLFSDP
jgi:hypothetical protein